MGPRLLLLRHGLIAANRDGRWHGSTDSPLLYRGRRQAKRTGKWLKKTTKIDAVYASPLTRCVETARLVSAQFKLPIETHEGLAELSIGEWEDMTFQALAEDKALFRRFRDDLDYRPPEGESINDVAARITAAFAEIEAQHDEEETVLVVSHGVALSIGVAKTVSGEPSGWSDYRLGNCSLTELYLSPATRLGFLNDQSHL